MRKLPRTGSYAYGKDQLAAKQGVGAARKYEQLLVLRRAARAEQEAEETWQRARNELADAVPSYLAGILAREDFLALSEKVEALWQEKEN